MTEPSGERERLPNVIYAKPNTRFGIMPQVTTATDITERRGMPMRIVPFEVEDTCRGRVKLIDHNKTEAELPLAVHIDLHDLTPEQIAQLRCGMVYADKEYEGVGKILKQTTVHPDKLTLAIKQWDDPETHKPFIIPLDVKNSGHFEWDIQFIVHDRTKPMPDS